MAFKAFLIAFLALEACILVIVLFLHLNIHCTFSGKRGFDKNCHYDRSILNMQNDANFTWIKYGNEEKDWAFLVNAWLCFERSTDHKKMNLIIYSSKDVILEKVRF